MRFRSIQLNDLPPIKKFEVDNLSDIVIIAGPNGVGKTKLIDTLIDAVLGSDYPNLHAIIEATSDDETQKWGKSTLDTCSVDDRKRLGPLTVRAFRIDGDRPVNSLAPAVDSERSNYWTILPVRYRFQDNIKTIFQRIREQNDTIARTALKLRKQGITTMTIDFPDPYARFQQIFLQLLGPKELLDPNIAQQTLSYSYDGEVLPISSLSSGEKEVLNIALDLLIREPRHSIILFDEPELHLHSELSLKLIQTLTTMGTNNQFIFCTHSPHIITAPLDQTVIFLSPPKPSGENQAMVVNKDDPTHEALKLLGQHIGIISLGKKVVLIEGSEASLDIQTYESICRSRFPDLALIPVGGKELLNSFSAINDSILEKSIWGIEFFVLCDRDTDPILAPGLENDNQQRLKTLYRYHIENYFLDEYILAQCFSNMEDAESWLRSPDQIRQKLQEIARTMLSYTAALYLSTQYRRQVGNLNIMPKGVENKSSDELISLMTESVSSERDRFMEILRAEEVSQSVLQIMESLERSLSDQDQWKRQFPGKQLFNKFANAASIGPARLRRLYLEVAGNYDPSPFEEIISIFQGFDTMRSSS